MVRSTIWRSHRHQRRATVPWLLFAATVMGVSIQTVVWLGGLAARPSLNELVEVLGLRLLVPVVFAAVSALILARQPAHMVGRLLLVTAFIQAFPFSLLNSDLSSPPAALTPAIWLMVWFEAWSWVLLVFPIFLIPLHFPTGRPPSHHWGWVNRLALAMWLFFMFFLAFSDTIGPTSNAWHVANPIGFIPLAELEGSFLLIWGVALVVLVGLSVASLLVRYRRAALTERQQIKWLLSTGALFVAFYALIYVLINMDLDASSTWDLAAWMNLLLLVSILAFPASIAIAIFRYRLYDIDIIIRKTLVYSLLTAILGGLYFGTVLMVQQLFRAATGETSDLALVLSTLLIAALFTPLRRRIQETIDRRFFRRKYDAEQTLARFNRTLRDEVDIGALQEQLVGVVQETMQPAKVALWLKE